ncbi:histidine kinase [Actinocorallia sp. API 0066]|uniref:sensor histidine kinase n=1 Tax=Actinocorallia sp. API 0066 TaxID=2896846 RepID=UPI001E381D53|nr:histidine kinase [Actinocorallia sp. API 0066]MCD0448632.1 histidine kinase [Actinocorallia sp. API 0066]
MSAARFAYPAGIRDWTIAACVAAVLLVTGLSGRNPGTDLNLLGYALLVAAGLALAARSRAPVPVLLVTGLCAVSYQAVGFDVPAVAYLFAVYAAVRAGHHIITLVVSVTMLVVLPLAVWIAPLHLTMGEAVAQSRNALELAWLVAAGAAGEALRQAERRADEAERTREEVARHRAVEERLHIARELHDSLTHQISVIKVQAEVAVHLARKRGERVPEALLAIQEAGREASRELRTTLEALRDDARTPPRGLDHVPELVERVRRTGLEATLTIEGHARNVPTAVDRAVYRIVQESLTNVARHSAGARATIRIAHLPAAVTVRVDDDGEATPATTPVPGVGLIGMRERVTALGGSLRAEPRHEGGFTVQAVLPVDRT